MIVTSCTLPYTPSRRGAVRRQLRQGNCCLVELKSLGLGEVESAVACDESSRHRDQKNDAAPRDSVRHAQPAYFYLDGLA